ncbi:MAG: toll/interleukin-1 receptor domain-containing protein [Candidatus Bathyarchaeia archaeon]
MSSIFVCHSSKDHSFVDWLKRELGKKGIFVWIDEGEISVGDSLIGKIEEGIKNTNYFGAVLSENSITSNWVRRELEMAITKEILGDRVFVLPIIIGDCDIPLYLKTKKYADFRKSDRIGLRDLSDVLIGRSHFQCMIIRQKIPATYIDGYRQKVVIRNYTGVEYKNESIPVFVSMRKKNVPNTCHFSINLKNLTTEAKSNIKVSVKPPDSGRRIIDYSAVQNTRILRGGKGLNFVEYDIPILHPYDEHHFGFEVNSEQWPEIDIICENSVWDGLCYKMDVTPQEYEKAFISTLDHERENA